MDNTTKFLLDFNKRVKEYLQKEKYWFKSEKYANNELYMFFEGSNHNDGMPFRARYGKYIPEAEGKYSIVSKQNDDELYISLFYEFANGGYVKKTFIEGSNGEDFKYSDLETKLKIEDLIEEFLKFNNEGFSNDFKASLLLTKNENDTVYFVVHIYLPLNENTFNNFLKAMNFLHSNELKDFVLNKLNPFFVTLLSSYDNSKSIPSGQINSGKSVYKNDNTASQKYVSSNQNNSLQDNQHISNNLSSKNMLESKWNSFLNFFKKFPFMK